MVDPNLAQPGGSRPPFPTLSRFGIAVMVLGLLFDFVEHDLAGSADASVRGFSLGEHAAHLVVLVGMVVVLAGIVRAGRRIQRRLPHQHRRLSHAVR